MVKAISGVAQAIPVLGARGRNTRSYAVSILGAKK